MKAIAMLVALVGLTAGTVSWSAAQTYDCHGDGFATYGVITLTVDGDDLTIEGSFAAADYGEKERNVNECKASKSKQLKDRIFFEAEKDADKTKVVCGDVDYAVIYESSLKKKAPKLALVNRTLADQHDYSGYAYASFGCSPKKTR